MWDQLKLSFLSLSRKAYWSVFLVEKWMHSIHRWTVHLHGHTATSSSSVALAISSFIGMLQLFTFIFKSLGITKKISIATFLKCGYSSEKHGYRTIWPIATFFRPRIQTWPKPRDYWPEGSMATLFQTRL